MEVLWDVASLLGLGQSRPNLTFTLELIVPRIHAFMTEEWFKANVTASKSRPSLHNLGHSLVMLGHRAYVWGGRSTHLKQLYYMNLRNDQLAWKAVDCTGQYPEGRIGHGACSYGEKRILIHGGSIDNKRFVETLHCFDPKTKSWAVVPTKGVGPVARAYHCAVFVSESEMLVFGGRNDDSFLNDCFILNFVTMKWKKQIMTGHVPKPRASFSATWDGKHLFIVGGVKEDGPTNELFVLQRTDQSIVHWTKIRQSGDVPSPRCHHTALLCGNTIMVHGGWDEKKLHDDMYILDIESMGWSRVQGLKPYTTSKCCPPAIAYHSACIDHGTMFVFGGWDGKGYNDNTYCLNMRTAVEALLAPSSRQSSRSSMDGSIEPVPGNPGVYVRSRPGSSSTQRTRGFADNLGDTPRGGTIGGRSSRDMGSARPTTAPSRRSGSGEDEYKPRVMLMTNGVWRDPRASSSALMLPPQLPVHHPWTRERNVTSAQHGHYFERSKREKI